MKHAAYQRPLKIGLVFDDSLDRPDGVQQYVLGLGSWLASQGHEVHYLAGETKRTDLPHLHSLTRNVQVRFNGNRLSIPRLASKRAIRQLLSEVEFDVLHVMMPYSPMMAARVITCAAPDTVVTGIFHILPQTGLVRLATHALGWWLWPSLRRFDKVFATSSASKRFAEAAFRLKDIEVSPNVVGLAQFQAAKAFGRYDDGVATIMFLGRLVPRKGCQTLLEAAAMLKQRYERPFRIVICGKGPLQAELQEQATKLGIGQLVEFTGFISEGDKPRYLASADLAVFPSTGGESFGIVLIEAMAARRPVVLAAGNAGYAAVMEPRPQQLFHPGHAAALAEQMAYFLDGKPPAAAARAWQQDYVKQFDTAVVGAGLLAEFRRQRHKKLQKPTPS
jgi:phosphatidyl-myo-inositol alpha-mannosyltransferase